MEKPLVCRPMRTYSIMTFFATALGSSMLFFAFWLATDGGLSSSYFFLSVAVLYFWGALWLHDHAKDKVIFFDQGIWRSVPKWKKCAFYPWSNYRYAYIVKDPKGYRYLVLCAKEMSRKNFFEKAFRKERKAYDKFFQICISFIDEEQQLRELVAEKIGPVVGLE
mgnify:FL=1